MIEIVLWILFFLIPISFTSLLSDSYSVPKWILVYVASIIVTAQLFVLFKKKSLRWGGGPLVVLCESALLLLLISAPHVALINALIFLAAVLVFINNNEDLIEKARRPFLFGQSFVLAKAVVEIFSCRYGEMIFLRSCFSSSFGNINQLAEYLVLSLPLLSYYLLNKKYSYEKWLNAVLMTASLFILYWAQSRSAYLGCALVLIYFFSTRYFKATQLKLLALPLVLILFTSFSWRDNFSLMNDQKKSDSSEARISLYQATLNLILDNPLGTGAQNFDFAIVPYKLKAPLKNIENEVDESPHSEILRWAAESGWLYLATMLAIFIVLAQDLYQLKSPLKPLFVATAFSLVPQIIFQFPFRDAFAFMFAAFILGVFLKNQKQHSVRIKTFSWAVWGLFTILVLHNLGVYSLSKYWEVQAADNASLSHLACRIYPDSWRACLNEIKVRLQDKDYSAVQRALQEELQRRPYNYFALRFASQMAFAQGQTQKSCEIARMYNFLLHDPVEMNSFIQEDCQAWPEPRYEMREFDKFYRAWLHQTVFQQ